MTTNEESSQQGGTEAGCSLPRKRHCNWILLRHTLVHSGWGPAGCLPSCCSAPGRSRPEGYLTPSSPPVCPRAYPPTLPTCPFYPVGQLSRPGAQRVEGHPALTWAQPRPASPGASFWLEKNSCSSPCLGEMTSNENLFSLASQDSTHCVVA